MSNGYTLSPELHAQLVKLIRKMRGARVTGAQQFVNSDDTFSIAIGNQTPRSGGGEGTPPYIVRIDSNATGGGMYACTLMGTDCAADNSGSLELPEGMTAGATGLLINADEDGQGTHWLRTSSYTTAVYAGTTTISGTTYKLFICRGGAARTASPSTIGSAAEATATANAATWDRAVVTSGTNYGDGPVEEWKVYGLYLADSVPQHLFAAMRKEIYDASGRQKSVGAETIVDLGEVQAAARYAEDQAEPDRTPAAGSATCDAVNLSKCRSKITVVVEGLLNSMYGYDVESFNGTWELTYNVAVVGPTVASNSWRYQIDANHVLTVYCSTHPYRWFVGGWVNNGGWGVLNDEFDAPNRSCPPLKKTPVRFGQVPATAEIIA